MTVSIIKGRRKLALLLPIALLLSTWSSISAASGLIVQPLRVDLSVAAPNASLTVRNAGDSPMQIQLSAMAWSQQQRVNMPPTDELASTRNVLAVPPMFELAPGESQVVRVGLRQRPDPSVAEFYRLQIRELPDPSSNAAVNMVLNITLPIFVNPTSTEVSADLTWLLRRQDNRWHLQASNSGKGHAQITRLKFDGADAQRINQYLLPGSTATWQLSPAQQFAGDQITFQATINGVDRAIRISVP